MERSKMREPRRDRRGAVLAEFIIAFMPICAMFLCVCQLSRYELAHLVTMRAAEMSARACAVIHEPMPGHKKEVDGPDSDIQEAAHVVMKGMTGTSNGSTELTITDPTCEHDDNGDSNGGTDKVTLNATYHCTIPLARNIVCASGDKTWTEEVSFPHQGADYKLDEEGD
jgi:hypothetical protein